MKPIHEMTDEEIEARMDERTEKRIEAQLPALRRGDEWVLRVCEVMGLPTHRVANLRIESEPGHPLKVHVAYWVNKEQLLDIELPPQESVEITTESVKEREDSVAEIIHRINERKNSRR